MRWWDGTAWTALVPRPPQARPAALPLPVAVGALVVTAFALVGGRYGIVPLARFDWPVAVYVVLGVVIGYGPMVLWCWYASRRWGTGSVVADFGLRFRPVDLGWSPLVWFVAVSAEVAVVVGVIAVGIPIRSNTEGIEDLGGDRGIVLALLLVSVVAAPFVEELVFRGAVQRGFSSVTSPWVAVALQGVLFGAAHVDPFRGWGNIGLLLALSAVGVVFGSAALLLRRIGPCIGAHAIFNGVVLAIVLAVG